MINKKRKDWKRISKVSQGSILKERIILALMLLFSVLTLFSLGGFDFSFETTTLGQDTSVIDQSRFNFFNFEEIGSLFVESIKSEPSGSLLTGAAVGIQNEGSSSEPLIGILGSGLGDGETPILNSSSLGDRINENLSVTYYEGAGNKTIIDWKLNANSTTVLNLPFEGGSNSTYTKDYSSYNFSGVVTGPTWNSTGGYDGKGSYLFVNNGQNIDYSANPINIGQNFTLVFWMYPTGSDTYGGLITQS